MMTEKPIVLLVDDNEATCTLIAAILQRDFATEIALDGGDAIEKLKTGHYAAVLLDIRMPRVDGYAVLDHMREHRPDRLRSVLIVTASLGDRELARVRQYDVWGVVAKPFDVDDLLNSVRRCAAPPSKGAFIGGAMLFLLADLIQHRLM